MCVSDVCQMRVCVSNVCFFFASPPSPPSRFVKYKRSCPACTEEPFPFFLLAYVLMYVTSIAYVHTRFPSGSRSHAPTRGSGSILRTAQIICECTRCHILSIVSPCIHESVPRALYKVRNIQIIETAILYYIKFEKN